MLRFVVHAFSLFLEESSMVRTGALIFVLLLLFVLVLLSHLRRTGDFGPSSGISEPIDPLRIGPRAESSRTYAAITDRERVQFLLERRPGRSDGNLRALAHRD